MTNINLNLYKIFCTVASSKSYSEASEKINLSVSNISTQISNLEKQLDTKLFEREANGVRLTESGEELYNIISKSILAFDFGEKMLKEKNDLANGSITIGCPSHITIYYLMDYIEKARKEYPKLQIKLVSDVSYDRMIELLINHEVDFIIMDIVPKDEANNLVIRQLKSINNILVSSRPLKIENIEELESLKYILNFENTNTTQKLMDILNKNNVKMNNKIESDITEIRVEMAKRGLGIAYVMKDAVRKEIENKELYEVEIPITLPAIDINLIYVKNQLSRVDKNFIKQYLS